MIYDYPIGFMRKLWMSLDNIWTKEHMLSKRFGYYNVDYRLYKLNSICTETLK